MNDDTISLSIEDANSENELLRAALKYAAMGVYVFPCEPCDKNPIGALVPRDRGPDGNWIKSSGGLKKATRDADIIRRWWTCRPDAMIGAATGAVSGFFAIDPDAPKPMRNGQRQPLDAMTPDGRKAWEELKAWHGGHAPTIEVTTPSGGYHVYFRYDQNRPVTNKEGSLGGQGINVRGDGGYVILPPSCRLDGKAYVATQPFSHEAIADAPQWLFGAIKTKRCKKKASPKPNWDARDQEDAQDTTSGNFPHTLERERQLREALARIPADNRDEWLRIGAALNALEWGDLGRQIWDEWSQTAPEKYDPEDQEKTWQAFDPNREDGARIGTINYEAKARGWKGDLRANAVSDDFVAYLPQHSYMYRPTRELWLGASFNSVLGKIPSRLLKKSILGADFRRLRSKLEWIVGA